MRKLIIAIFLFCLLRLGYAQGITTAEVWTQTVTNVTNIDPPVVLKHAVYPSCECDGCTGKIKQELTEVFEVSKARVNGVVVELSRVKISASMRPFKWAQTKEYTGAPSTNAWRLLQR